MMVDDGGGSRMMMLVATVIFCSDGGELFNQLKALLSIRWSPVDIKVGSSMSSDSRFANGRNSYVDLGRGRIWRSIKQLKC